MPRDEQAPRRRPVRGGGKGPGYETVKKGGKQPPKAPPPPKSIRTPPKPPPPANKTQ